jgi:LmbE family N-acetylglucosaminyl deacetylase
MHLFLSPHLDDAVYSCGGMIHRLTKNGEKVLILTLMAGDSPDPLPDSPFVRELHTRWSVGHNPIAVRRMEDIAAAQAVGAEVRHHEYPDCIYRTLQSEVLYPSEESIFGTVHTGDKVVQTLAVETVMFKAVYPGIHTIYVPLGVGNHVDHQIVHEWGRNVYEHYPSLGIKYYEEYPYIREPGSVERALDRLPFKLTPELQLLDEANMKAKIKAIACHRSQLSTFWDDEADMQRDVRRVFSHGEGVYGERFWM